MDQEKQPEGNTEDNAEKPSVIKQHALPLSVIIMSWISGIIACGVTCSFATSPSNVLFNHPSGKVRVAAWTWALLAILLSGYIGIHVGKDVRHRYRRDKQ